MGAPGPAKLFRVFLSADRLHVVLKDFPAFTPMPIGSAKLTALAVRTACFHCRKRAVYHRPIILETV